MIIYKEEVTLPKNSMFELLEGLTGKECYDKYGLKRDEALTLTVKFPNDYQADIKICVCDEDYTCFTEMILFDKNGNEVCFTEPADSVLGEWELDDLDGNIYHVDVTVED